MKGLRACSLNRLRHLIYDERFCWFAAAAPAAAAREKVRANSQMTQRLGPYCTIAFTVPSYSVGGGGAPLGLGKNVWKRKHDDLFLSGGGEG
jgi:hypothetical protein